jgi:hypothetical protein
MNRKYLLGEVTGVLGKAVNESRIALRLSVIKPQLMRINTHLNETVHLELLHESTIKVVMAFFKKPNP